MSSLTIDTFDPLATHPFTNTSGLAPQPLQPSIYSYPISTPPHNSKFNASTSPSAISPSPPSLPIHSPRPRRGSPSKPMDGQTKPIFVPFRQDRSSPDLGDILSKKKSPSSFDSKLSSSPGKSS